MKFPYTTLIIALLILSSVVKAQTSKDTSIFKKSAGALSGQIVSESTNSIKLKTENFGIVTIGRNEIVDDGNISIETKDGKVYKGKVIDEDDKKVVLQTLHSTSATTILKRDIQYSGDEIGFHETTKNAVSFNFLGTAPLAGITYERLLSRHAGIEVGFGFLSLGAGLKVYPFQVKTGKALFHTGITFTYFIVPSGWGGAAYVGYIPIGISVFGKSGFNFGADVGPAYISDSGMSPYGNLKVGYRF